MGGVAEKQVDARMAWAVAAVLTVGLVAWQWPGISDFIQTTQKNEAEAQATEASLAKTKAHDLARINDLAQRERSMGIKAVLDGLLAKPSYSLDESSDLREAFNHYADTLGPDVMKYSESGYPIFKGPQSAYLLKAFKRSENPPLAEPPASYAPVASAPSSVPVAAPTTPSSGTWRTVAHFTGRGIKNTPSFTVPDEWRVRWKARGDGIFQIYAYGPDGMPQPAANVQGADADESYMHGGGSWYLNLNASERYEVWVETK